MKTPLSDAELETALTEWGQAARSVAGHQPIPDLRPTAGRPRRFGWQLAAGATAVAVAVAVAVGLPRLLAQDPSGVGPGGVGPGGVGPLGGITGAASAPPGFQVVTFHGLSITVPASWQVTTGRHCQLTRSVIELPAYAESTCGRAGYFNLTIIDFYEGTELLASEAVHSTQTTISGVPATRVGVNFGRPAVGYLVPRLSAGVLIMPAAGQTGADLEASLAVNAVDSPGCPARITDENIFPPRAGAGRSGTAQALIPGQPTSMRACRYVQGWVEWGATVSGAALRSFDTAVNGLPAGLSRADSNLGYKCGSTGTGPQVPPPADIYRFELRYPDGPPVLLSGRVGFCGKSGIANGSRTGQLTQALSEALIDTVDSAGLVSPDEVTPAR